MANKEVQETAGGYVDNIRVKISEKYKPPPKIGLPMSYAQRLTLNKQIQDTIPPYEFLLEKTVIEKMQEWKTTRSVMLKELNERLEKARAELKKKQDEKEEEVEASPSNDLYLNSGPSQCYQQNQLLMPTKATHSFSNILTPIPLNQTISYKSPEKSPFNISDFEADTSSPFDNMELKSINDLEELAQVLKSDPETYSTPQSSTSLPFQMISPSNYSYTIPSSTSYIQSQPVSTLYASTNGYYYPPETIQANSSYNSPYRYSNQMENRNYSSSPVKDSKLSTYKSIPDIMKTLQNELDNTHLDNTRIVEPSRKKSDVFPKAKTKSDDFTEEFHLLPKSMQDMSKSISSMGFPLSRVARVCKLVGNDQKKVVEHLLAMSELLDLGFPESSVSKALLLSNNDRDKALDILIS